MKIKRKRIVQGVGFCVGLIVLGVFAFNGWALNQKQGEDTVVVTVNEIQITRAQVDDKIGTMLGPQAGTLPPEKLAAIRNQVDGKVIENMIIETLLTDAVEKQGITVNDKELDGALSKIKASVPLGVGFQEFLKEKGMSEQDLRKMLSQDLRIRKLLESRFTGLSSPSDEKMSAFYKENPEKFQTPENVEVRHILVSVKEGDSETAKAEKMKRAEEIRQKLIAKNGNNFEEIAVAMSDCPSKSKGGMLGKVAKGQTVKPFEDAAFSQKKGEIGPVVETVFGYHVIEVLKHNKETTLSFVEVKESISDYLLAQKRQDLIKEYIDSLKTQASIVYNTQNTQTKNPT